jgi:N-acetylmuramoyl-L-alanine amidase
MSHLLLLAGLLAGPRVVLDPGHGGSNRGALGQRGVPEKRLTLSLARLVARYLSDEGVQVALTRDRDDYVTLRERVRRANRAQPDCFVSLHLNASVDHRRRGSETFLLSREAAEVEGWRAGQELMQDAENGAEPLLAELQVLQFHRRSARLAQAIQSRLSEARPFSGANARVKQEVFDVLAGVDAPAVLVEAGFLDHATEGVELLDPSVERRTARAVADGILDFLSVKKSDGLGPTAPPPDSATDVPADPVEPQFRKRRHLPAPGQIWVKGKGRFMVLAPAAPEHERN